MPAPVKIEPPSMGVDLHRDAVLGAGFQNPVDVDLIPGAALQLTTGMADNGRVGIFDCLEDSFCLFLLCHFETAVNARDNEIELAEYAVGVIEEPSARISASVPFRIRKDLPYRLLSLSASRCYSAISSSDRPPA